MHRFLSTLVLGAALIAPVSMKADDDDHRDKVKNRRYYDRDAKDYHQWNAQEDRAYRRYLQEQRQRDLAWERANAAQQRAYWKWRHQHPDVYGDRYDRR